jgi:hypothetical protein
MYHCHALINGLILVRNKIANDSPSQVLIAVPFWRSI